MCMCIVHFIVFCLSISGLLSFLLFYYATVMCIRIALYSASGFGPLTSLHVRLGPLSPSPKPSRLVLLFVPEKVFLVGRQFATQTDSLSP